MAKNIHVVVDDDVHERLSRIKNDHGLTWEGMLLHAANDLDTTE
ncbi:hypothetical protein [Haloferax chudinovii]|jgi:hypothetical protein|uniref:CopG family transcriptional regulator n=1 Tax=Haloferax chudinovii TaxID=1109010 RepID=A0ABD5XI54_9EURY